MKADISFYLDTRRALKDGKFPLKLYVYYPPKNEKWFPLDYSLSVNDFENSYQAERPRNDLKGLKLELEAIIVKANDIAKVEILMKVTTPFRFKLTTRSGAN